MTLILVMLIALLPRLASGQETPGFAVCDEPAATKSIVGAWLHNAVQNHGQYLGLRVWTQFELLADGEAIENYFSENPNLSDVPTFSRRTTIHRPIVTPASAARSCPSFAASYYRRPKTKCYSPPRPFSGWPIAPRS